MTVSLIKTATCKDLAPVDGPPSSTRGRIVRQSTGVLAGQVLGLACGFSSNLLVAWLLGPQGKGLIYLIQFTASTAVIFLNMGLGPSVVFHLGRERGYSEEEIASTILWPSLLLGALPAILLGLSWPWIGHFATARLGFAYLWMALVAVPGMVLTWNVNFFNLAKGRILAYNFLQVATPVLFLLGSVWVSLSASRAVISVAIVWLISVSIPALYAAAIVRRRRAPRVGPKRDFLSEVFRFGGRSHLGAVTQYLQHRVDILLVGILLPLSDVGLYSVAVVVAELLWYLPNTLAAVLMPHVAASSDEEATRLTAAVCRGTVAVNAILAVALAVTCSWLVPRILPAFRSSVQLIWLLLPGAIAASAFKVLSSDFNGRGKPLETFRPAAVSLVVCLTAGLLLIPRFGIDGAAIVTSGGYFLNAYLYLRAFSRASSVSYADLLLLRSEDVSSINRILRPWAAQTEE
jgi:O-antigen/teichoic acid export membrane protein